MGTTNCLPKWMQYTLVLLSVQFELPSIYTFEVIKLKNFAFLCYFVCNSMGSSTACSTYDPSVLFMPYLCY